MIRLVVGLGNPGQRYRGTRHNVGFEVLDRVASLLGAPLDRDGEHGSWTLPDGSEVHWVRPQTYMNLSGKALKPYRNKPWYGPESVLVCYDDFALPLGSLRIRKKGSAGGHNGMTSIIEALGSPEIPRMRIGIGPVPVGIPAEDFVLKRFTPDERSALESALQGAAQAVVVAVSEGVEAAMNKYNRS